MNIHPGYWLLLLGLLLAVSVGLSVFVVLQRSPGSAPWAYVLMGLLWLFTTVLGIRQKRIPRNRK